MLQNYLIIILMIMTVVSTGLAIYFGVKYNNMSGNICKPPAPTASPEFVSWE